MLDAAHKIWREESTARIIAEDASRIIHIACNRNSVFFSGKSARGVLSGLFYCLSLSHGDTKTQQEIARSLDTNEVTVRASSRDWLECFPDLFPEINKEKSAASTETDKESHDEPL